jgi:hypothetical protein
MQDSSYSQAGYGAGQQTMATAAAQVLYMVSFKSSPCTAALWVSTVTVCGDMVALVRDLHVGNFLWLQPAYGAQQQASHGYTQGGQGGAVAQAAQGLAPDQQARVSQIVAQVTIFTRRALRSSVGMCPR